jgi:hypothetical protein
MIPGKISISANQLIFFFAPEKRNLCALSSNKSAPTLSFFAGAQHAAPLQLKDCSSRLT